MRTNLQHYQSSSKIEWDNHCFLSGVLERGNQEATETIVSSEKSWRHHFEKFKVHRF